MLQPNPYSSKIDSDPPRCLLFFILCLVIMPDFEVACWLASCTVTIAGKKLLLVIISYKYTKKMSQYCS